MMYQVMPCYNCGSPNPSDNQFCGTCGTKLPKRRVNDEDSATPGHNLLPKQQNDTYEREKPQVNVNVSEIERYDRQLLQDIGKLKEFMFQHEEDSKSFLNIHEPTYNEIQEFDNEKYRTGEFRLMHGGSNMETVEFLDNLVAKYKSFHFRFYYSFRPVAHYDFKGPERIITVHGIYFLNTLFLSDEEFRTVRKFIHEMIHFSTKSKHQYAGVHRYFPSPEFMGFIDQMLAKYGDTKILCINRNDDSRWIELTY